jgi:hypothetical protein
MKELQVWIALTTIALAVSVFSHNFQTLFDSGGLMIARYLKVQGRSSKEHELEVEILVVLIMIMILV